MNTIYFKTQGAFEARLEQMQCVPGTTTVVGTVQAQGGETHGAHVFTNGQLVALLVLDEVEFFNAPAMERGEAVNQAKDEALAQLRGWLFDNRMRCVGNNMEAKTEVWGTPSNELLLIEDTGDNFRLWLSVPFIDLDAAMEALDAHFAFNQIHF